MSIRIFTTAAVDCDSCHEVYADTVALTEDQIQAFAKRDGWIINPDDTHTCPGCVRAKMAQNIETANKGREARHVVSHV
jgi:hypothetical protein